MTKRSADTFAKHESVPSGALPFFIPRVKRVRGSGGSAAPPSPSDPLTFQCQANSSSSDDMNDVAVADLADAVSAHHLAAAPSCSSVSLAGSATLQLLGLADCLHALGIHIAPHCPDARLFLEQLVNCLLGCRHANPGGLAASSAAAGSLSTALWHAFAELNVVLARHFSELPTCMLRGYHSFTRAPRDQLWFRFAASQGAEMGEEAHAGSAARWLALTRFLLEHALAACPTASCVMYSIEVPTWLRGWCARWGHPPHSALRVLAVFAYELTATTSGAPSTASSTASSSPRALYVPCVALSDFC